MKTRLTALAALLAVAGCGTGDETDSYKLVTVRGHVTLDGKPLEGAKVLFTPDEGNKPNTPGVDTTGKEGNYILMYRGRSGVAPGKYSVLVSKTFDPAVLKASEEFKGDPVLEAMAKQQALVAQGVKGPGKRAVPGNVSGTFEREVAKSGEEFDFDLKKH